MDDGFVSGYVQRTPNETYEGSVRIEGGIDLSPIQAVYFKNDGESYLWLRRKPILEYDISKGAFTKRDRKPSWECYLKKQMDGDAVAYRGEFVFMHFRYSIIGVWDAVLGNDKRHRLNLFVERLPMNQQNIINSINERKRNERGKRS